MAINRISTLTAVRRVNKGLTAAQAKAKLAKLSPVEAASIRDQAVIQQYGARTTRKPSAYAQFAKENWAATPGKNLGEKAPKFKAAYAKLTAAQKAALRKRSSPKVSTVGVHNYLASKLSSKLQGLTIGQRQSAIAAAIKQMSAAQLKELAPAAQAYRRERAAVRASRVARKPRKASGFAKFIKANKAEFKGTSAPVAVRKLAAKWRAMTVPQKAKF